MGRRPGRVQTGRLQPAGETVPRGCVSLWFTVRAQTPSWSASGSHANLLSHGSRENTCVTSRLGTVISLRRSCRRRIRGWPCPRCPRASTGLCAGDSGRPGLWEHRDRVSVSVGRSRVTCNPCAKKGPFSQNCLRGDSLLAKVNVAVASGYLISGTCVFLSSRHSSGAVRASVVCASG